MASSETETSLFVPKTTGSNVVIVSKSQLEPTNPHQPTLSRHYNCRWMMLIPLFILSFIFSAMIKREFFYHSADPPITALQAKSVFHHFTINQNGTDLNCSHKTKWDYLWFQHVRKTGGTTILGILKSNGLIGSRSHIGSPESRYYAFWFLGTNLKGLEARADAVHSKVMSFEAVSFHVNEFLNHPLRFHNVLMLTIIREPIQRAWSDLNYPTVWDCSKTDSWMSCAQNNQYWISNFYVRHFAGLIPKPYFTDNTVNQEVLDNAEVVQQMHLDLSLLILKQFDIVLILDHYETQRVQLSSHGISNTTMQRKRVNSKKKKEEMTPELAEYLRRINTFDLKFFEAAKEIASQKTMCAQSLVNVGW